MSSSESNNAQRSHKSGKNSVENEATVREHDENDKVGNRNCIHFF